MLATSMLLMLITVYGQNRKMGSKRIIREMIPVVVGLKPALDAYRVASGAKIEEKQALNPLEEMTFIRAIEMFAEAIPGAIIQLAAILSENGEASSIAITSLIASALTTGFVSASISFDWDTDPKNRLINPEFYGFIPNSARKRTGEMKETANQLTINNYYHHHHPSWSGYFHS